MKPSSTFTKISREFQVKFDELAAEISHNQTAGEAREYALINLLKGYLPQRVGLVIDTHGEESKQIDIVIYDKTVGTVFDINNIKYFPCETVVAVGEVKSDIDSAKKLQDYNQRTNRRYWMNVFCAFNQFLISYESPRALYPSAMDAKYIYCTKDSEASDLLLLFYCILARSVDETRVARPDYFSYAQIDKTEATYHDLFDGDIRGHS
jgi:hypothetical protein